MAAPALTHFAQRIYDALDPLTYDDANQGYSLAYFCSAIATMFDQVQGYVETRDDGTPGWGALMNADSAPVEVLPWLGQFVGVQVPDGLTEDQQRALVKDVGGFRRGTVASLIAAAQQYLTGTKAVTVLERYGSPYHLRVSTRQSETPDSDWDYFKNLVTNPSFEVDTAGWSTASIYGQNVGATLTRDTTVAEVGAASGKIVTTNTLAAEGASISFNVTAGKTYTASAWVKGSVGGEALQIMLAGLVGAGGVGINNSTVFNATTGWQRVTTSITAVTSGVLALILRTSGATANTFFIDGAMVVEGTTMPAYFDGNTDGHRWTGTPNASTSEVISTSIILNALLSQKPAGIVLDYVTLTGGDFNTVRDTNASFNAVVASYKDFNELKLHPNKRSTWGYQDVPNVATGGEATYAAVVTDYTNYLDLLTPTS